MLMWLFADWDREGSAFHDWMSEPYIPKAGTVVSQQVIILKEQLLQLNSEYQGIRDVHSSHVKQTGRKMTLQNKEIAIGQSIRQESHR